MTASTRVGRRSSLLFSVLCLLLAAHQRADAYTDPGSGAMVWQLAAASVIGMMFYVRRLVTWLRSVAGERINAASGFLFATVYGGASTAIALRLFATRPIPRFGDIFLIGVVLTVYLFSWQPAIYLYIWSLAVMVYVLPPYEHFRIAQEGDIYRMVSYSVCCLFVIWIIDRVRSNRMATSRRSSESASVKPRLQAQSQSQLTA